MRAALAVAVLLSGCIATPSGAPPKPPIPSSMTVCILSPIHKMSHIDQEGYFKEARYLEAGAGTASCDLVVKKVGEGEAFWKSFLATWPQRYQDFQVTSGRSGKKLWKFRTHAIADNQINIVNLGLIYDHFK